MTREEMITDNLNNQWNKGILTTPKYISAIQDHAIALEQRKAELEQIVKDLQKDRDKFNTISAELFVSRTKCYERIEELEENIDNAIGELEDCGWYSGDDKAQTMEVIYKLKGDA
jgi:chromosome segregation ATPase